MATPVSSRRTCLGRRLVSTVFLRVGPARARRCPACAIAAKADSWLSLSPCQGLARVSAALMVGLLHQPGLVRRQQDAPPSTLGEVALEVTTRLRGPWTPSAIGTGGSRISRCGRNSLQRGDETGEV